MGDPNDCMDLGHVGQGVSWIVEMHVLTHLVDILLVLYFGEVLDVLRLLCLFA